MTDIGEPELLSPVHATPVDADTNVKAGIALCLSGGGYRAMVFHVGVLWRLNETNLSSKLQRIRRSRADRSPQVFWPNDGRS